MRKMKKLTLSDQPTDVTESPSTDRSHRRVTWTDGRKINTHGKPIGLPLVGFYSASLCRHVGEIAYLAGAGAPQVDAGAQSHAEYVQRGPVHQIEVEIVLELWSIQNFKRNFGYFARGFSWWPQKFLTEMQEKLKCKCDFTWEETWQVGGGVNYLLLLTGEREYGETVFPSSSDRALLALTEYYNANQYLTK